jgi:hypothetical protein
MNKFYYGPVGYPAQQICYSYFYAQTIWFLIGLLPTVLIVIVNAVMAVFAATIVRFSG